MIQTIASQIQNINKYYNIISLQLKHRCYFNVTNLEVFTKIIHISTLSDTSRKLDLHIGEPMQICIHRKDNSPKPVNHHLTLKEGPKVKSENIRRFPANDLL